MSVEQINARCLSVRHARSGGEAGGRDGSRQHVAQGSSMKSGTVLAIGERDEYYDFSF